jgi:Tol biopolymer transport system component
MVDPGMTMPLWFIEGMAEYMSIGPRDPNTAMWLRDAALENKLPTIAKLDQSRYFPYRFGQALWAFVASRYGEQRVGEIFKAGGGRGVTVERAFEAVLGFPADSLSREWVRATKAWATGQEEGGATAAGLTSTKGSGTVGRLLLGPTGERGRLNVSPTLSPDGSKVAFLSERGLFSIEMFVADAATGKVLRSLTKAAVDPHLQSLQFIHSAGSWSPDGERIAVAAVLNGQPTLEIMNASSGKVVKSVRFREMGEIYHPTWSPDGKEIVFSGLVGGASDLFIVDLSNGRHRRLTQDLFADLQPAWSPDGKTIAFASDRFSTNLETLKYGPLQVVSLDVATGAIHPVPGADQGKNINPQWSPDGSSLYFVSDRSGISNIYRLAVGSADVKAVTDVPTGVSGITSLSPAFSVARRADRAVFSVYEKGGYRIHALESSSLTGTPPAAARSHADLLPAATSDVGVTANLVDSLPDSTAFKHNRYRAGLSLDSIGQVGVGVAAGGNGGVAIAGGSALFWSDMLGDHNLGTQFQLSTAQGGLGRNLAAVVAYQNLKNRWNWILTGGQIPSFWRTFETEEVGSVGIARDNRFWEIERQVHGVMAYPFNRAQRIEMGLGYRNIDFQSEVQTQTFDLITGEMVSDITRPGPEDSIPSLGLVEGLAALVYDNSIFGGTGPIRGQRYRFEVAPVGGDLRYVGVLADYRRYLKVAGPFTLAGRAVHMGRYGPDSDTQQLSPLYLGYPWLVRGYDSSSFTVDECGNGVNCPAYDKLFGSRLALGNIELRMPLFGALGVVRSPMVPPVEVAAFYDAGVAWYESLKPDFLGGPRTGVSSYGGAFRVNLLGFAVAEISYVRPQDRPVKGAYWLFALQPGF